MIRATAKARSILNRSGPLTLLLDNSVLRFGVSHEETLVKTATSAYFARARVQYEPEQHRCVADNVQYLAPIAYLARKSFLQLKTSAEIMDEAAKHPSGHFRGYSYYSHSLFADVAVESVDGWVFPTIGPSWMNLAKPEDQQQQRLSASTDPLYHSLRNILGQNKSQDAWHICTAERHGLFGFLTMDFKLVRHLYSLRQNEPIKSLKTKILTPKTLADELNLAPVDSRMLCYNDASYPVEPNALVVRQRPSRR